METLNHHADNVKFEMNAELGRGIMLKHITLGKLLGADTKSG